MPFDAVHRPALKLAAAAALGLLIPTIAHPLAIALTAFVPVLWLSQHHRAWAYASSGAYYLSAIWPVIPVVHRFNGSFLVGFVIWAGAALLLALPWMIFRPRTSKQALWCGPAAIVLTVVPPLGIISVACPVSAAGYLFPGMKIAGLLAAVILPGAILWRPYSIIPIVAAMILLANLYHVGASPRAVDWEGVDTIGGAAPEETLGDYGRIEMILDHAESSRAKVIVFPEATIRSWTATTLMFFDDRIAGLRKEGKTVLTGAIRLDTIGYGNVVEAFGSTTAVFEQRVPVPIGMWRPTSAEGVPLDVFGPSTLRIAGQNAAILICYEQLITWPAVMATLQEPSVLVAVGNDIVVRNWSIEHVKRSIVGSWARLWDAPAVKATAL